MGDRWAQGRVRAGERLGEGVLDRAGLAGKAAAGDGAIDVILLAPVGHVERLVDDQTKRRAGEIDRLIAAVHLDLAGAGLQPDASDGILAAAGGIRSEEHTSELQSLMRI